MNLYSRLTSMSLAVLFLVFALISLSDPDVHWIFPITFTMLTILTLVEAWLMP